MRKQRPRSGWKASSPLFVSLWTGALLLFSFSLALGAGPRERMSIQAAIRKSGARWTSGDTPISRLAPEERRMYLGGRVSPIPPPEVAASSVSASAALPSRLDWRSHKGASWVTPVRDQGPCGSCWAFSVVGTLESVVAIRANNPGLRLDLSEQFVLACSAGTCGGWWVSPAADFLRTTGVVDEDCLPYTGNDKNRCSDRCGDWSDRIWKIDRWQSVPNDVNAIRSALNQKVLTTAFDVYTDFYYYTGGVYEHVWGDYEGGHAVVLVGYDDTEHAWIAKNSWGTAWGEEGYFRILWGDSRVGRDTLLFQYSNPCDDDEDGYADPSCGGDDCDDNDPLVYPGAEEVCDGTDNDCDGILPASERDVDEDTWMICAGDCMDWYARVHPGAVEACDNWLDDDCDGAVDGEDMECELSAAGWSAAEPAEASSFRPDPTSSAPVASRVVNTALWALVPTASFGIGRFLLRRERKRSRAQGARTGRDRQTA